MKTKNLILLGIVFSLLLISLVGATERTVCCEKTKATPERGYLFCQNVPEEQCDPSAQKVPTSCESTSYCKLGYCYNSVEGTCLDNTPRVVCNANGGIWSEEMPKQCELGCCVLGDQAAFVSLVRCKRLSSFLGVQVNYKKEITNEVACILSVQNQEKGACVFESEFEKTCKLTTRGDCTQNINKTKGSNVQFYPGKLCSAEELGTICAPTRKTMCVPGKDEVYFQDSCGNPANIYDSSKVDDKRYWSVILDKLDACSPSNGNANSKTCGNCNYLQGTICRQAEKNNKPIYGDYICDDLNCKKTSNGKSYKHGESWCVYDDAGTFGKGNNAVGSEFFKHICINGEEVLEACQGFRAQECIEDSIETPVGPFSQAACRVNRWQDCTAQDNKKDCENIDKRDCIWKEGISLGNSTIGGVCLPKNSPGLKFWEGSEAKDQCALGNANCVVVFEKDIFGNEKCVKNCECLTSKWRAEREEICMALGDCGPKVNWLGEKGYKEGFDLTIK